MNATSFQLPSPAKVNHFLHIIGRTENGFHRLQTLFQFLTLSDTLHFELRQDSKIVITSNTTIPVESNLIFKAAQQLQKATSITQGITIHLDKLLPIGGGLGGGSSNAATTLVGLNLIWSLHWGLAQLKSLALSLGADVSIFVHGQTAWGEGVGEQLTSVQMHERWLAVIIPPCQVMTAKMFSSSELTRNTPAFKIGSLTKDEIDCALSQYRNDFEPLVRRTYPEVDAIMKWLSNFGRAQLSGSGACVFSCFDTLSEAAQIIQQLPQGYRGWVAKATNESPLLAAVKKLGLKQAIPTTDDFSGRRQAFETQECIQNT